MNSSNNNLDDERIKQQRREAAARRRAAKQRAQARENTEAAQQSQPRRRAQQPANRQQAASNQQPTQRRQQAANRQQAAGNQQAAKRKQAAGQQQPAARTQRRQQAGAPSDQQRTQRSQGAASRAQQPASRQQPRQRNSVRADADRQQQRSQQQQVRQQQRAQQQQAHRQQMREQTMREHQQRMQQQRNQYGKGAYSAANYAGRNGATRAAVATAGAHTQAPQNLNESMEQAHRKRRRRTIIIAVIAAIVIVLGGATAAFAMSAMSAKGTAQELVTQVENLATQVKAGDMTGAKATAADFSKTAKELHNTTNNPLWAAATIVPVYGSDINNVRILAEVADTLSEQVLMPVVNALPEQGLKSLFSDGAINVQALQNLLVPLGNSASTIHALSDKVDKMGESHISQLEKPVATVKSALDTLDSVSGRAAEISNVLPAMLGVNGPRDYLLIACTEAEYRSVGGFPGSAGIMTVDNGKIHIGGFSAPNVDFTPEGVQMEHSAEESRIFGDRIANYFYDAGYVPHFPRAATLMKQIWEINGLPEVAGIVSVDPVFLQRILALTGPVTTSDGTVVDGNNAAEMLMNTAYIKYGGESEAYHQFFSDVASQAMGVVFGNVGSVSMVGFFNTMLKSIEDKRFYAWMVDPQEQSLLESFDVACAVSDNEVEPETGVYVGAAMGSKIGWYLDFDTTVSNGRKNADGTTSYDVTVTLTNTLTDEAALTLPDVVTGNGYVPLKRSPSDMIYDVYLYAPAGGTISNMQANGYFEPSTEFGGGWYTQPTDEPMTKASYNGREVWYGVTAINGTTGTTLTYTVTTSPKATSELKVDMTPLANENL